MGDTVCSSKVQLPYLAGLDGLRAISVLAVFFYHANFRWAVGGFLGVECFFVISGYLITSLLLREYLDTHQFALGRFWMRRARRLLPALWLVVTTAVIMAFRWAPDALPRLREDVPAAFLYVSNWVFIFREVPYFEGFGRPPLLQHLWSLAVEEQFYLIWPLALWGALHVLRARDSRQAPWLAFPILLGVAASSAWMASLYDPLGDPSRVYYGTDTRAAGFLLGACLAVIWPPKRHAGRRSWVVDATGLSGLVGMVWLFTTVNEYEPFLYRGGFLLTALATCLVLVAGSCQEARLARVLGTPPLRWIGTRSYGIYLWHWPLMAVTSWGAPSALPSGAVAALQLLATFLLAELSYRWIEQPIRKGGFRSCWAGLWKSPRKFRMDATAVGGLLVLVGCIAIQPASSAHAQTSAGSSGPRTAATPFSAPLPGAPLAAGYTAAPPAIPLRQPSSQGPYPARQHVRTANSLASTAPGMADAIEPGAASDSSEAGALPKITFIGDSVMESAGPWLEREFAPDSYYLEAARKRRMEDALTLIPGLAETGLLADTVVIHLGTNVPFEEAVFDGVMRSLLDHGVSRVLFVTIRRPIAWEWTVNHRLEEGVGRWPEAELVDWHQHSETQPGWFIADAVHPTHTGAEAYVDLIRVAVEARDLGGTEPGRGSDRSKDRTWDS